MIRTLDAKTATEQKQDFMMLKKSTLPNMTFSVPLKLKKQNLVVQLAIVTSLLGCAVGPDFVPPKAPETSTKFTYTQSPSPEQLDPGVGSTKKQKFIPGGQIPAQWWVLFHNEALNRLITKALENNPNLLAAESSLKSAAEIYNYQFGSLMVPNVTGSLTSQREKINLLQAQQAGTPNAQGAVLGLLNASVNVSYNFDIFGANRRLLESQKAQMEYQAYQLEAAYLTLTSNVVTTSIKEASLREQIKATKELLKAQSTQLDVIQKQFAMGAIGRAPVLQQINIVAQTRASLPALEKSLAQTRHQLSVYAGLLPSESVEAEFDLDSIDLPQELPVSLASDLIRQRPDIKASEALLHQASAQVGVATANQYPQFNISGSYGTSSSQQADLFKGPTYFWDVASGVTAPIFNAGALSAKLRASKASYEQAAQQYKATVLGAFQNVADALRALDEDTQTLNAQAQVEAISKEALELSTKQYQLGATSYLSLLDAQRTYQQALIGLITAKAARYADTAALFQSLGGGWWTKSTNVSHNELNQDLKKSNDASNLALSTPGSINQH